MKGRKNHTVFMAAISFRAVVHIAPVYLMLHLKCVILGRIDVLDVLLLKTRITWFALLII